MVKTADDLRRMIPWMKGKPRNDFFREIDHRLENYGSSFTEQDLKIIEDGINAENRRLFERAQERKAKLDEVRKLRERK